LKGVKYRPVGAGPILRRNMLVYGGAASSCRLSASKLIDMFLVATKLA